MARINPPGFPVERGKIHEFAVAILDEHPHYHDEETARAAGLPSVVAPPTFPIASALYAGADPMTAEDIAETIWWVATLPPHLNVNTLELMPVSQSFAGFQVARS